jgi:hypothetical protein
MTPKVITPTVITPTVITLPVLASAVITPTVLVYTVEAITSMFQIFQLQLQVCNINGAMTLGTTTPCITTFGLDTLRIAIKMPYPALMTLSIQ